MVSETAPQMRTEQVPQQVVKPAYEEDAVGSSPVPNHALLLDKDQLEQLNSENVVGTATLLNRAGLKVIPIRPQSRRRYKVRELDYVPKLPEHQYERLFHRKNIAVCPGKHSNGLFLEQCHTLDFFLHECRRLGDKVAWATCVDDDYYIWLRCSDGVVGDMQCADYEIVGEGYRLIPPSVNPRGEIGLWLMRDGNLPPSMSAAEVRAFWPDVNVRDAQIGNHGDPVKITTPEIQQFLDWANHRPWSGKTGRTQRDVLREFCRRAQLEGCERFRATRREVALGAEISRDSADRAIKALLAAGYVIFVMRKHRANYYRLNLELCKPEAHLDHTAPNDDWQLIHDHEAFSPVGLGTSAASVYYELRKGQETTKKGIAARVGCAPSTVAEAIKKLQPFDLVYRSDGAWHARPCSPERLDEIAKALGVLGHREMLRQRFEKEREENAATLLLGIMKEYEKY